MRKRSAASLTAPRRLEKAVFYLDESIYSRVLAERIAASGASVRIPGDPFPRGTLDHVWLSACGTNEWIVLMRDQRVRRRPLELAALHQFKVGAFVLTAGQATATETADAVERLLTKFVNISVSERRPFLYTFNLRSRPRRV